VQIPDVPPQLLTALVEAAAGQRLALVGGVVRDLLLHRHHQDPWRGLPDLDLVVEGQAADLVARLPAALEDHFGTAIPLRQQPHGRYGTVKLELQLPQFLGGSWLVDLASARREVYLHPASNPMVYPGTIEEDLLRRDFTINAMALEIFGGNLADGNLLDLFGGLKDLAQRKLRLLHDQSIRDDPTRIIRAARYAARLNFDLAPETLLQLSQILKEWPWLWKPGSSPISAPPALSTRLRAELDLLLQREPWQKALSFLQSWGALEILDRSLQNSCVWRRRLHWADRLQLPLLLSIVASSEDSLSLAKRLRLSYRHLSVIESASSLIERISFLSEESINSMKPSQWCALFEEKQYCSQAVNLALFVGGVPLRPALHWWYVWRHLKSPVKARQLIAQGHLPGPSLGAELSKLRLDSIDLHGYRMRCHL